jgi:hypothetical protein
MHPARVGEDRGADGLDLGAGDLALELVVVLDADLLDAAELVPAVLDDVV